MPGRPEDLDWPARGDIDLRGRAGPRSAPSGGGVFVCSRSREHIAARGARTARLHVCLDVRLVHKPDSINGEQRARTSIVRIDPVHRALLLREDVFHVGATSISCRWPAPRLRASVCLRRLAESSKIEVRIPRDREGTFDPKLIQRYQRRFRAFLRLRRQDRIDVGPRHERAGDPGPSRRTLPESILLSAPAPPSAPRFS